jgi:hypothetical protein
MSKRGAGAPQRPTQWVRGISRVKSPGREADQSPPSSAEVKSKWIYTLSPAIRNSQAEKFKFQKL